MNQYLQSVQRVEVTTSGKNFRLTTQFPTGSYSRFHLISATRRKVILAP